MKYLIDTSVLNRLRDDRMRAVVRMYCDRSEIARTSITDLEYCYSARNSKEWAELLETVSVFDFIDVEPKHFQRAMQVQQMLASKLQRGRKIPDLLVAAVAEERGLTVLHYDADFDHIAEVTGQQCEWVIPAGEIS